MSARATFWAWDIQVPSSEKLVLLCLADCHNGDTGQCNPSVNYISRQTSLERKTVLKALSLLNDKSLLSRVKVSGSSNWYTLSIGSANIGTGVVPNMGQGVVPNLGHKPTSKPKKNLSWTEEDKKVAESIYQKLLDLNSKHKKPNMDSWSNEIRLMRESDGHSHDEINDLFAYANSDKFWQSNILSPKKLREKWDVLTIKKGDTSSSPKLTWI